MFLSLAFLPHEISIPIPLRFALFPVAKGGWGDFFSDS